MPRPPVIRVGLQLRMTLPLIKSDSYKGLKQTAALRSILTQCPSETPTTNSFHEQLSISN